MINEVRSQLKLASTPPARPAAASTNATPAEPTDCATLSAQPATLASLRTAVAAEASSLEKKLPEHLPGEVLVRTKPGADVASLTKSYGLQVVEKFDIPEQMRASGFKGELYLMKAGGDLRTSEAIAILGKDKRIASASSNDVLHLIEPTERKPAAAPVAGRTNTVPNDLDSRLWGMNNTGQDGGKAGADIHATQAWSVQTGSRSGPVIAVIDTGVDYTHPEIANNVWNNPDPAAPDRHGYNFVDNRPDPMDDHSHGTHCSGTIAGEGNNGQGVVGVNWQAQIMGLKFLSASGSGSTADAVRAVAYATEHGARITSNSWDGGGFNQARYDVLKASPARHIFAAGNSRNDNDAAPSYPASYNLDNIVAVAASDRNDDKAPFSNYGKRSVDVAAPGKDILSTVLNHDYAVYSGTSMATPHVAGVAGLIATQFPDATNEQIKSRLMNGVDRLPNWSNLVASGGRVNAANALETDDVAPAAPGDLRGEATSGRGFTVSWTATGDDGLEGTASSYDLRWSDRPITEDGQEGAVSFTDASVVDTQNPQAPGSAEQIGVAVPPSSSERTLYFALKVSDNVGNVSPLSVGTVTVPAASVAFEDDPANDPANWTLDAPWTRAEDATRGSVWSSNAGEGQDNNANVSLTSRPIDLSSLHNSALCFASKKDLESGFDFLDVEVSDNDGASWTSLDRSSGSADWSTSTIDLSAYDGKQVRVRFHVTTDGSVNSAGVKLDDIVVVGD